MYAFAGPLAFAKSGIDWKSLASTDVKPLKPVVGNIYSVGKEVMVSTDHPLATEAALWALARGGNAADAYMTAAIAQCVLEPTMTTLAGGFGLGYFNAEKGGMQMSGCGFAPPAALPYDLPYDEARAWTGWSALVPGFLRGLQVTHENIGRLPWKDLWEPGIAFAENGFVMDHILWGHSIAHRKMLGRFEGAGRDTWMADGYMPEIGSRFRQPELAATMRQLQRHGADWFYQGEFAKSFVDKVNRHGGQFTMDDMAAMQGYSTPPTTPGPATLSGKYRGYDVGFMGMGLNILATRLLERADLSKMGHTSEDPEALYTMIRIVQEIWGHDAPSFSMDAADSSNAMVTMHRANISDENVERVWNLIESGPAKPFKGFAAGTCALSIVDAEGNVACGTHSSSSESYGSGIYVGGIIVNRPVFLRKYKDLPAGISTAQWVFKDGKPVYAMATPSRSFLEAVLQATANTFEYGMNLKESVTAKRFGHPHPGFEEIEIEGDIDWRIQQDLVKRGVKLFPVSANDFNMGSIHAIHMPGDAKIHGVADPRRRGQAKGF